MTGNKALTMAPLRRLSSAQVGDAELLEQFLTQADAEAFAELVRRYGSLVLGVCRRALRDEHSAEDVFQATFLVLARSADTIRNRRSLSSWLHGVALRLARKANAAATHALMDDACLVPDPSPEPPVEASWREVRQILDDELGRLPEKYRLPLILCYLQGRTREEAAAELGRTPEQLKGLLERGRERLRNRLIRRGLAPATVGSILLTETVLATPVPSLLTITTSHAATRFAAGVALVSCGILGPVVALTEGGLRPMASKTRALTVTLALVVGVIGSGAAILAQRSVPTPTSDPKDGALPSKKAEPPTKAALDALLPAESRHTFEPVNKEWKSRVAYLLNESGDDLPNSLLVVKPEERDPNVKGYIKEVRYFAKEGERDRRIRRYHPDGSLASDMDIVGEEQFDCFYEPDGAVRAFVHWRKGKWIGGYSVSPDGATVHRLAGGTGELVTYGKKAGNSEHRWYSEGANFLSKQYRNGSVTSIRLNGPEDWFIVDKTQELLLANSKREVWTKPAGGVARMQALTEQPFLGQENWRAPDPGEAQRTAERYLLRRTAFVEAYGTFLTKGGYTWDKLGIEFFRKGSAWPY